MKKKPTITWLLSALVWWRKRGRVKRKSHTSRLDPISFGLLAAFFIVSLCGPQAFGANLTIPTEGKITVEFISSDAHFRNTLSVVSPAVGIAISDCRLESTLGLPGVHILSEKTSQSGCMVELDAGTATPGIQPFAANTTFEFGLCVQTDVDPDCEFVWSSNPAKNPDGFDHVIITQSQNSPDRIFKLAWEDLPDGGDMDFNDFIVVIRAELPKVSAPLDSPSSLGESLSPLRIAPRVYVDEKDTPGLANADRKLTISVTVENPGLDSRTLVLCPMLHVHDPQEAPLDGQILAITADGGQKISIQDIGLTARLEHRTRPSAGR